ERVRPAALSASSTHCAIVWTIACPPSRAGVGRLARPRIRLSAPTTPARIFVPPRSIPTTGGPAPCPAILVRPPPLGCIALVGRATGAGARDLNRSGRLRGIGRGRFSRGLAGVADDILELDPQLPHQRGPRQADLVGDGGDPVQLLVPAADTFGVGHA